jgi:hypothetical protein
VPSAEPAPEEAGAPVTEAEIDAALAEEAATDETAVG